MRSFCAFFFFNDTATTEIYTLSLHDALPILLERPTELTVTDSAATVTGLVLQSAYGTGKLVLQGALPTRGRADAHIQLEGFPLVGVYALLERDTAGVGGTLTVTAGLSGTRASPVSSGSFSLSNGAFGEFRAPFVDGTYDYHDRRLLGAVHLWRSGQQILGVQAYLPLDLLARAPQVHRAQQRSEEHTSELQSRLHLVCRLLLEKKNRMNQARGGSRECLHRPPRRRQRAGAQDRGQRRGRGAPEARRSRSL